MEKLVTPAFWRGRRVFVTGHTGFKGGWLTPKDEPVPALPPADPKAAAARELGGAESRASNPDNPQPETPRPQQPK